MKQGSKIPLFFRALPQNPMILLERGSRGLAPSQMSAAGEIFQDLRYATLDPTLDQVQPFQNWPWTTLALHRMGDLGPRWATLDRPWTAWSKVGPMPKSQHCLIHRELSRFARLPAVGSSQNFGGQEVGTLRPLGTSQKLQ